MFEPPEEKSPEIVPTSEEKKYPDKVKLISVVAGIGGSILVFIGNFMPVVNWAKTESGTFINAFPVFGWLFISLSILSFVILALPKKFLSVFVGILALSLLAYSYHRNQTERDKRIASGEDDYWTSIVDTSAENYTERREAAKKLAKIFREENLSLMKKESSWVWISLITGCLSLVISGVLSNNGLRKWLVRNFALYEPEKR